MALSITNHGKWHYVQNYVMLHGRSQRGTLGCHSPPKNSSIM